MTCRVARLFQQSTQIKPVACCTCGTRDLDVFFTSRALGLHLCSTCAQSMIVGEVGKELSARAKQEEPEHH